VDSVTNHDCARYGTDGESLAEAALRAPGLLRSRDRAVTAEDFETLTREAGKGAIVRVKCLTPGETDIPGTVRLVVVPFADPELAAQDQGIDPDQLALTEPLRQQINEYLDDRRLLGIRTELVEPTYVGVQVRTQVKLRPEYDNEAAQAQILANLRSQLYQYLNPLTGGPDGTGWPFGQPVYASDIVALLQKVPAVLYVGRVRLFETHREEEGQWSPLQMATSDGPWAEGECVEPGALGLICSWNSRQLRSSHRVDLVPG
jgi:predicted phage baseplate assembly protein